MTDAAAEPRDDSPELPELLARDIQLVPLSELRPHPHNPNRGDPDAIAESASQVGFYQVVFVQRSTGYILAGHSRVEYLSEVGSDVAPVVYLDVDDETALRILVGDNEIPRQHSRSDERALAYVLSQLGGSQPGLVGTGHDSETLTALLARLAAPVAPDAFPDAEALAGHIEHRCPSCGYEWSGSPTPAAGSPAPVA